MLDKVYRQLIKKKNLELAFQRIRTGQNIDYKNYYRNIFDSYSLTIDKNIQNLHERLKSGIYKPSGVLRFYIPKDNGLHRTITFLHVEDMIIYQAIANIYAKKFKKQRKELENKVVFSNILSSTENPIFLFEKWQKGFLNYIKQIKKYFRSGNKWVAHFDLAAYYDTIDHKALCSRYSRKENKDFCKLLYKCLETWSTHKEHKNKKLGHGIPQGPIASNLLSEIYFLPIDKIMLRKKIKYIRYVDDIRIFGKAKSEVQESIIILERECKEWGLIPQSKKYAIKEAKTEEEAIGRFPSLTEEEKIDFSINQNKEYNVFIKAFESEPMDVSKVKYILFNSRKNEKILDVVLNNLSQKPELVKEFCCFLIKYFNRTDIAKKIFGVIENQEIPYKFIEGKYWELLAYFKMEIELQQNATNLVFEKIKKSSNEYSLKYGLYKFIFSRNNLNLSPNMMNWLANEPSALLQAMISNSILYEYYDSEAFRKLIIQYYKRSNFEPLMTLLKELFYHDKISIIKDIISPKIIRNGVIRNMLGLKNKIDAIQILLENRYEIYNDFNKWKNFLENEYQHANQILYLAEKSYESDHTAWLNYIDSFNEIITRKFIELLEKKFPSNNWPKVKNKNGKYVDFGQLLDKNNLLSKNYNNIFNNFRDTHQRRCTTPASHPYDKKSLDRAKTVDLKEQKTITSKLSSSYNELIINLNKLL